MSEVVEQSEIKLMPNLRRTNEDIRWAVNLWQRDKADAEATYGPASLWDTSCVTDMSSLFCGATEFNEDISGWDVSNVLTMRCLFNYAHSFNCDIRNWETGKVQNMYHIFASAQSFRCDVSEWDVSTVDFENMDDAFYDCPVKVVSIWKLHKDDADWKEQCKQNREFRREQIREKRRRDANWERRRPWMVVISPFLKQKGITESPIQSVFDEQGLARNITSFV